MKNADTPLGLEGLFQFFQLSLEADGLPHTNSCYLRDARRFWDYLE